MKAKRLGLLLLPLLLYGASIRKDISVSTAELKFSKIKNYDFVTVEPCDFISKPGYPQLPIQNVYLLLPPGAVVNSISVIEVDTERLEGTYNMYPAQHKVPLSVAEKPPFTQPDEVIYSSKKPFPGEIIEFVRQGNLGGYNIGIFRFYPLRYVPSKGELSLTKRVVFEVDYSVGSKKSVLKGRSPIGAKAYEKFLKHFVLNPEDIPHFRPKIRDDNGFDYLIITSNALVDAFTPLAEWKTQKGYKCVIRTVSWITSHYSGWDTAEKIRNYLKIAYADSGLVWVLLGGDTDIVPCRKAYVYAEGYEDEAPSDLYYSDLDGTWDEDGDHTYGEMEDNLDLFPDLYVGRAPVSNSTEAQMFVNKALNYQLNPTSDYLTTMLFMAEYLWEGCSGHVSKDTIDNNYVPDYFDITKLYEATGNLNYSNAMNALNEGKAYINHSGHAYYDALSIGSSSLTRSDFDNLVNGDKQGVFYSIGCWSAAFDYDCIAEHYIMNPNGGGVVYIGNSRYGWGDSENPGGGPSELFDQMFFKALFIDGDYQAGVAHAASKLYYIASATDTGAMRWCYLNLNLLGEVELPLWTDDPRALDVYMPDVVYIGPNSIQVSVHISGSPTPVPDALVCAMKEDEVYERAFTNENGQAVLYVEPSSLGKLYITVTAQNALPYEDSIDVIPPTGPYVVHLSHAIDDDETGQSFGDSDSLLNPGEQIELSIVVKNFGVETAHRVIGVLSSPSPYVALLDSVANFGTIAPDGYAQSNHPYVITIAGDCPDSAKITFQLSITDSLGNTWSSLFTETVLAPILNYRSYFADDSDGGNNNGYAEPGETVAVSVTITNTGSDEATLASASVSSSSPYIEILDSTTLFPYIPVGGAGTSYPFRVHVLESAPQTTTAPVILNLIDAYGFTTSLEFSFTIGQVGFSDDMESGEGDWTHASITPSYNDQWHLSTERYHSSIHSWKCGNAGASGYANYLDAGLVTPVIQLPPNAELVFWHWMDAETSSYYTGYAYDGGVVEISTDGVNWTQIEPGDGYTHFIRGGSGNPLPEGTPCFSGSFDWREEHFDLSEYSGSVRIRFRFTSDQGVGKEGWYIDDITVVSGIAPEIEVEPLKFVLTVPLFEADTETLRLINAGGTDLSFTITVYQDASLKIRKELVLTDWLTVSPLSGTIASQDEALIAVIVNTEGLINGQYMGRIDISSNDPDEPLISVPVILTAEGCIPGDVNGSGSVTSTDLVYLANYLYYGTGTPTECADANGDCEINIADLNYLGEYLFSSGPPPQNPCSNGGVKGK